MNAKAHLFGPFQQCQRCFSATHGHDSILCDNCVAIVAQEDEERDRIYRDLIAKHQKTNKFRIEILKTKDTKHAKLAHDWICKLTAPFKYSVGKEKPFPPYIVDILIKGYGKTIAIEVDGGVHDTRQAYDISRDIFLKEHYGVDVYRFTNEQIETTYFEHSILEVVLKPIKEFCLGHGVIINSDCVGVSKNKNIDKARPMRIKWNGRCPNCSAQLKERKSKKCDRSSLVVDSTGAKYRLIPFLRKNKKEPPKYCPGCGVGHLMVHHSTCPLEECPKCHGKMAACKCNLVDMKNVNVCVEYK